MAESFDAGLAWSELSEWLHRRGLITAALGEIADAAGGTVPGARDGGRHAGRSPAGERSGRDRAAPGARGISLVAVDHYGHKFTPALQATLPPDTAAGDELARFLPLLKGLDFQAVFGGTGREAQLQAEIYRLFVGDSATADMLASGTSPPLAASAMLERRGRAVNRAQMAFKDEQERPGDEFARKAGSSPGRSG